MPRKLKVYRTPMGFAAIRKRRDDLDAEERKLRRAGETAIAAAKTTLDRERDAYDAAS